MFAGSGLLLPVSIIFVTLVPETREEGGTRCQRALAAEGDRGAEEIGQQEETEIASGCPKLWCWSKRRTGGTEDSLPCSWVEEGWLPSERERRSRPVRLEAEACCHPPCLGRSRERGTRCRLPSTGGAIAVRRPPSARRWRSIGPSTKDVQYHRMAPRVNRSAGWGPSGSVSWNRTEIFFFFFFSPLSRLCHSSSFRLLFSRLVCPYPQVHRGRPDGLPRERGEGGSRAQSLEYPPACEGRWGYVTSGAGPRAVGTERGRWSNW